MIFMKQALVIGGIVVVAAAGFMFMNRAPEQPVEQPQVTVTETTSTETEVTAQPLSGSGNYELVASESQMKWEGKKVLIPNYTDTGVIAVKDGSFVVEDGMVTSGTFTIDMTTIGAESTGRGSGESMLTNHLKSPDFFDVAQYPESTFVITSVTKNEEVENGYTVTGDLTLKANTHEVSFPAVITQTGDKLVAVGKAELDRTNWDVRFGSGKFFKNLGDNVIDDMFAVEFTLVGAPASN